MSIIQKLTRIWLKESQRLDFSSVVKDNSRSITVHPPPSVIMSQYAWKPPVPSG